jgi:hypothetical protein
MELSSRNIEMLQERLRRFGTGSVRIDIREGARRIGVTIEERFYLPVEEDALPGTAGRMIRKIRK